MKLADRVALVTGGSAGSGEAVALRFASEGARVGVVASAAIGKAERVVNKIAAAGGVARPFVADVARVAQIEALVEAVIHSFGRIDILVNAAGIWVEEPLHEASYEQIRAFVDTDVSGALQITRAALPDLMKDGGRIVHINGLQGLIRVRPPVLYATVESAVRGLCESLRWEVAPHGVHVGFITLGSVANEEAPSPDPAPLHEDGKRYRLSRDEVADAVLFMLSRPVGVNVDELVLTPLGQKF